MCTSGFGDRIYTQTESVSLFNVTQPNRSAISQHMVRRVDAKFRKFGNVCDIKKSGRNLANEDDELHVLLTVQEGPEMVIAEVGSKVHS